VTRPGQVRLEYHRSHLRYYLKHNGVVLTALLRLLLLGRAGISWLAGLPRGTSGRQQRDAAVKLAQLAWRGR
jgi:hypothetical protein